MTPAQVAHIMALVEDFAAATCDYSHDCAGVQELVILDEARAAIEAALRDAPQQAEIDAITELNHAQWLALENVRHLAARNRNEEWAQHMLRWCTEAGNAARILRTPSAPTAVEPTELSMSMFATFADFEAAKRQSAVEPTGEEVSVVEPDEREAWTDECVDDLCWSAFESAMASGVSVDSFRWLANSLRAKQLPARASKGTK